MKSPIQRRRIILFASFSILLAGGLGAFAFYQLRPQVDPEGFQRWLGGAEKASLNETLSPMAEKPEEDPIIDIPGLIVEPGSRNLTETSESTIFRARIKPTQAEDIYAGIQAYWTRQGLEAAPVKDLLVGTNAAGDEYTAMWNHDTGPDGVVLLWRVRKLNGGINSNHSAQQWPKEFEGLFPPIPAGPNVMETGRPGYAGYCVVVQTETDPQVAFRSMIADLAKRGWIPLHDEVAKSLTAQLNAPDLDMYSMVYRHKSAPFGCQVLVRRGEAGLHTANVMLALF